MRPLISFDRTDQFIKKRTWTPQEDDLLVSYIRRYGIWNWAEMSKAAGLMRSGKSCRLRWMNYLRPNIKRGNYSKEEEDTIFKLHGKLGNKWSSIAASLRGRTDNDVKNHWHTHLKKQIKTKHQDLRTKMPMQDMDTIKSNPRVEQYDNSPQKELIPALPSGIPVSSNPGLSFLTNGLTSPSSESWVPPRGLWDYEFNEFSKESILSTEDNSWSSYVDYSLWFDESAIYTNTSDKEVAGAFWDGLFMH